MICSHSVDQTANQLLGLHPLVKGRGCRRQGKRQKHLLDECMGENVNVKLMESISGGGKSEACGHNHS